MVKWNSVEAAKLGAAIKRKKTVNKLCDVLDLLCNYTDRNITVILPEDEKEQIPFLKKEIENCLKLIDNP